MLLLVVGLLEELEEHRVRVWMGLMEQPLVVNLVLEVVAEVKALLAMEDGVEMEVPEPEAEVEVRDPLEEDQEDLVDTVGFASLRSAPHEHLCNDRRQQCRTRPC